ncbi:hypothetical protein [Oribacterium sp. WCC10]|uniref:hypothetical protein n=1 Tax=Oribacterium sp. WCC10 TaxID=1855343 RepID=UPI0008F3F92C|nr:hypothetical protein [Oribacterium sp. WCC10]SFG06926.1 Polygalacturonase [Oribacterium sp. WCC10]
MSRERRLAFRRAMSIALIMSMTAGTTFTNVGMQVYAAEQAADEETSKRKTEVESRDDVVEEAGQEKENVTDDSGAKDDKEESDDKQDKKADKENDSEEKNVKDTTGGGEKSEVADSEDKESSGEKKEASDGKTSENPDGKSKDASKSSKENTENTEDSADSSKKKTSDEDVVKDADSSEKNDDSAGSTGKKSSDATEKGKSGDEKSGKTKAGEENAEDGKSEAEDKESVVEEEASEKSEKKNGTSGDKKAVEETNESLNSKSAVSDAGKVEENVNPEVNTQELVENKELLGLEAKSGDTLEEKIKSNIDEVLSEKENTEKRFHNDEGSTDITEITVPELAKDESSVSFVWEKPENYKDIEDYKIYVAEGDGEEKYLETASENYAKHADWAETYRKAFYEKHKDAVKISIHTYYADNLKPDTNYTFTVVPVDKSGNEIGGAATIDVQTNPALTEDEIHYVTDFGAKPVENAYTTYNDEINEEIVANTKAIQAAIDACGEGEKVVIPKGIFMSGALYLHSNMTLELEEGAVLKGSPNVDHYDQNYILYPYSTDTRSWSLVNVYSADEDHPYENIRIVGKGTIDGNGWKSIDKDSDHSEDPSDKDYISPQYFSGKNSNVLTGGYLAKDATKKAAEARGEDLSKEPSKVAYNTRPSLVMIRGTRNFYMEGVTLVNPAYHTLAVLDSDTVTTNNVKYLTYDCNNGDGIEIGNTQNAMVYNCFFDTGDDAVNFATGMGKAVDDTKQKSSSNIWTFDNVFRECHGGAIAAGSHTGAGISDMLVEDNVLNYADMPFRFKSAPANGGSIHDVEIRDCAVANCEQLFVMTTMYSDSNGVSDTETADKPAEFYNISAFNISCDTTTKNAFSLIADIDPNDPSKPIHHHHDLYFQDITVKKSAKFADKDSKNNKALNIDKIQGEVLDGIEDATFYNVKINHNGDNKIWNKIINCKNLRFIDGSESAQTKNAEVAPVWDEEAELNVASEAETDTEVATGSELKRVKDTEVATGSELKKATDTAKNSDCLKLVFDAAVDKDLDGKDLSDGIRYSIETYIDGGEKLIDVTKLFKKTEYEMKNLSAGVEYTFKVFAYDETGNKTEGPSFSHTIEGDNDDLKIPENLDMTGLKADVYTSVPITLADARKVDPRVRGYHIYINGETEPRSTYYYYQLGSKKFSGNNVTLIADRLTDGDPGEEINRKYNDIRVTAFADDGTEFTYNEATSTTWQMYDFKAPEWTSEELKVERDGDDIALSWDEPYDESGIGGYRVYVDGKPVYTDNGDYFNHVNGAYTTEDTRFIVSGLDLTVDHEFKVTAGDNWWRARKNEAPYHWTNAAAEGKWTVLKETDDPEKKEENTDPKTVDDETDGKKDDSEKNEYQDTNKDDLSGRKHVRRSSGGGSGSGNSSVSGKGYEAGRVLGANRVEPSTMGFWSKDEKGWKFSSVSGESAVNSWKQCEYNGTVAWYRFDKDGYIISGWFQDEDNNLYYFCPDHDGRFGQMLTGWQTIDGKEYYFETVEGKTQGRIYANEMTPDGHFVGPDGAKIR